MYSWYPVSIGPPITVVSLDTVLNSLSSDNDSLDTNCTNVGRLPVSGCLHTH